MKRVFASAFIVASVFAYATTKTSNVKTTSPPIPVFEVAKAVYPAERLSLLPPGQPTCVYLIAKTIGLSQIACPGDESLIDSGKVAYLTWVLDAEYFAGHRTTYGGVFNKVPSLQVGDIVTVQSSHVTNYQVAEVITINVHLVFDEIAKDEWGPAKPLALQTSHPLGPEYRYLVVAKQV